MPFKHLDSTEPTTDGQLMSVEGKNIQLWLEMSISSVSFPNLINNRFLSIVLYNPSSLIYVIQTWKKYSPEKNY